MKMTPTEALIHQAQTRPKSTAFVFHDETWSYERLATEADRLARGMAARGVKAGDRVVLHMLNRPEMLVACYACFGLGAIAAPMRTAFKFAELAPLVQRLQPALYIGETGLYGNVPRSTPPSWHRRTASLSMDGPKTMASSRTGRCSMAPRTHARKPRPRPTNPPC
jgi:acyl-CoA synthetase (AMP-forming)/AMP-acid ligase II